jgi:hypothetical protein
MLEIEEIMAAPEIRERNGKKDPWKDGFVGPCLVCGAPVKKGSGVMVHLHMGGGTIVTQEEAAAWEARCAADPEWTSDSGDLGGYPIGPACYRKHKKVLKPYVDDFAAAMKV